MSLPDAKPLALALVRIALCPAWEIDLMLTSLTVFSGKTLALKAGLSLLYVQYSVTSASFSCQLPSFCSRVAALRVWDIPSVKMPKAQSSDAAMYRVFISPIPRLAAAAASISCLVEFPRGRSWATLASSPR